MARRNNGTGLVELPFPFGGLDEGHAYRKQPQRTRESHGTYVRGQNVRPFDPRTGRLRGSSRPGLSKFVSSQISGSARIQCIDTVSKARDNDITGTSLQTREITFVAVAGGDVKTFTSSAVASPTGGTDALSSSVPVIFASEHFQELFFVDGTNFVVYDPATDTVSAWVIGQDDDGNDLGELPVDGSNTPRLIEVWRGRMVLAGIRTDPQNWFMSAVNNAYDFEYDPVRTCATQAVSGNNARAAKCPDIINCLIPYSDEILIAGCDHSIWRLYGDPYDGGVWDLVSDTTGMAWGRPWCRDPYGVVYFFGSRGGIYRMVPGQAPSRMTGMRLERSLANVNLSENIIRMAWDDAEQGMDIFITPLTPGATTHYFYDQRTDSFHPVVFANTNHNPTVACVLDSDDPDDRVLVMGSEDGYIRKKDFDAISDDSTAIQSYVWIGPIQTSDFAKLLVTEIQALLANDSVELKWELFSGESPEDALDRKVPRAKGTWKGGRNRSERARAQGHAIYLKLENRKVDSSWSIEEILIRLQQAGYAAQRGF